MNRLAQNGPRTWESMQCKTTRWWSYIMPFVFVFVFGWWVGYIICIMSFVFADGGWMVGVGLGMHGGGGHLYMAIP